MSIRADTIEHIVINGVDAIISILIIVRILNFGSALTGLDHVGSTQEHTSTVEQTRSASNRPINDIFHSILLDLQRFLAKRTAERRGGGPLCDLSTFLSTETIPVRHGVL